MTGRRPDSRRRRRDVRSSWLLRNQRLGLVRSTTGIVARDGNKLEILFEHAGPKKVLDSFVSAS
jgi:hypothetical protein